MKRLAGVLFILVLVFSMAIAWAENFPGDEYREATFSIEAIETEEGFSVNDAAEKYILHAFGLLDLPQGKPLLEGTVELTGANKILYDALVELVQDVAAGRETSTVCEIPMSAFGIQTSYTARELGVDSIFVDGDVPDSTWAKFNKKIKDAMNLDLNLVWNKLRSDYTYEMFWASNLHITDGGYPGSSARSDENGERIFIPEGSVFSYPLYVIADYSVSKTKGTTECDPVFCTAVTNAVSNAHEIVANNEGKSDRAKLQAYKDAICGMTSYNTEAADQSPNYPNENPWQLVWALDGDPETEVVCEGYSKAFKALCDLSSFMDASVSIVTGSMSGGTGAGGHMWNLVQIQGEQYLVDVTNCDEGTIGYSDQLFLAGYDQEDEGWYIYYVDGGYVAYLYDEEMYNLYSAEDLAASQTDYVEQPIITATATEIAPGESITLTARVPGQNEFHIYCETGEDGFWFDGPGSFVSGQELLMYTIALNGEGVYTFYAGYLDNATGNLIRTDASVQVTVTDTTPKPITVTGAKKVGTDITILINKEDEWENLYLEIDYVPDEANRENILWEMDVPDTLSVIGTNFMNAGTYQVKLSQISELADGDLDFDNPVELATTAFTMEAQPLEQCPGSISAEVITAGDELTYTTEVAEAIAYQIWMTHPLTGDMIFGSNPPINPSSTTSTVSIGYDGNAGILGGYIWVKINGVWTQPKEIQVTVNPLGILVAPTVRWRNQSAEDSLTLSPGMTSMTVNAEEADGVYWSMNDEAGEWVDSDFLEGTAGRIELADHFAPGAEYTLTITPMKTGYQSTDKVITIRCWDVPVVPEQIVPGQDVIVHHNPVEGAVSYNVGVWDGFGCIYYESREEPGDFAIPAPMFSDGGFYDLGIGASNGIMGDDWLWIDVPYNNVEAYTAQQSLTAVPVGEVAFGIQDASFRLSVESPERVLVQQNEEPDAESETWSNLLDLTSPGQTISFANVEPENYFNSTTFRFCALENGVWTQWSDPVTIIVANADGTMNAGDYTPRGTVEQLPADLQRIEEQAFQGVSMTEIDIPAGVTFIADDAFDGCGLVAIYTHNNPIAIEFATEHGIIALTE